MTDPPRSPNPDAPPAVGGERRLPRAPSDRYRAATATDTRASPVDKAPADTTPSVRSDATAGVSPGRGIAFGSSAAVLGATLIVLFGGALAVSAGLLVVAAAIGYSVALATNAGAGDTFPKGRRPWIAAALAALGVALGQVGLWLYARAEGGVLPPFDYLAQTFGALVPIELLLAAGVAWWRAR